MADTLTTNYKWVMPQDQGSPNTWGQKLNSNLQAIDATLWNVSQTYVGQITPNAINWSNSAITVGSQLRWQMALQGTESGGDAGSDLALTGYNDDGSAQSPPAIVFTRAPVIGGQGTPNPTTTLGPVTFNAPASFATMATATAGFTVQGGLQMIASGIGFYSAIPPGGGQGSGFIQYGGISVTTTPSQLTIYGPTAERMTLSGGAFAINGAVNLGAVSSSDYPRINFINASGAYGATISLGPGASQPFTISASGATLTLDQSHNFNYSGAGLCTKPGGGPWSSPSDERIKDVEHTYELGIDEVLELNPVVYRYKGNDGVHSPDKQHVGLIAQEVESVIPDMVERRKGMIDGREVDDLRVLDTTQLIFALVNCIKNLNERLEALER